MKITFLGANRQVTGSRYLLEAGGRRILIDCGLFQERALLERNWEPSPVPPDSIDCLVLTHAHLDHSGLIPKLVRDGYAGPILATEPTQDLARLILLDSAEIQEEDAAFKLRRHEKENRRGPRPVGPLYNENDARKALRLFRSHPYGKAITLSDRVTLRLYDSGHILGSAIAAFEVSGTGGSKTVVFSGDLGQYDKPLTRDPTCLSRADCVVLESTYGDSTHPGTSEIDDQLCRIIGETVEAGGNLIIPTFAIERAQELTYALSRLVWQDRIPNLLIFLDSPLASEATEVFRRHVSFLDEGVQSALAAGETPFDFQGFYPIRTVNESKAINRIQGSCIIMAGSGMCTAGRIKHHLARHISRPQSTVLFAGFQASGTLGRQILDGASQVRILGRQHPVRARIEQIYGLSAHADRPDLSRWLGCFDPPPPRLFLTHGEVEVSSRLAADLNLPGCQVEVPDYGQSVEL